MSTPLTQLASEHLPDVQAWKHEKWYETTLWRTDRATA